IIEIKEDTIKEKFIPIAPLRQLEVIEGDYEDAIQEKLKVKGKDNYLHFKLKHMSHVSDPMVHLKQIYPNTLALTNQTFDFSAHIHQDNYEIQKLDDETIIDKFYKNITDEELTQTQSKTVAKVLNDLLEGGSE
ncbi:MAG: exonuclease sbcCD subunit D, partial [Staphylococcus equorum]|nr:exonuclease sbcCD subunit D [Staphylococcus equorum]